MRFCHVTTFYPPWSYGGDGILVQKICEALALQGHLIDVVHCEDAYRLKRPLETMRFSDPPGIRRHVLRSKAGALSPLITQQTGKPGLKHRKLQEILSESYDVVHFHNVSLVGGPGVLSLSQAPVTLYTTHDHWLVCPTHVLWKYRRKPCDGRECFRCSLASGIPPQLWRYTPLLARSLENVDAILAPSHFIAEEHRRAGIERPIHVHHSFASRTKPHKAQSALENSRPLRPQFVYAGRIEASKGVPDLLSAMRQRPQYDLLIAGDGSLLKPLRQEYADCEHIRFLGMLPHEEISRLYLDATAVISPTWGPESFHLVTIEAMSLGIPVIGRRAGGSVETIEKTGGGLIYQQPDELLPLVDRLVEDDSLREQLRQRATSGYQQYFSEEKWMSQYFDIIKKIAIAS